MKKRILLISLILSMALSLSACRLADPDSANHYQSPRIIGLVIERLDDIPPESPAEDELVYARRGGERYFPEYTFEDNRIIPCFMAEFDTENGKDRITYTTFPLTEVVHSTIDEDQSLSCTLYVSTGFNGVFLLRKVFQSPGGEVYYVRSAGDDVLRASELTEDSSAGRTVNAFYRDDGGAIKKRATTINFKKAVPADSVVIMQMDGGNALLSREKYAADSLPDEVKLLADTEYVIVETKTGGETRREILTLENEYTSYMVFYEMDGICMPQNIGFVLN